MKKKPALYSRRNGKMVDDWLHEEILSQGDGDAERVGEDVARSIGLTEEEIKSLKEIN